MNSNDPETLSPAQYTPGETTPLREIILPCLIMVAASVVIYWPALTGGFVWDDALLIQKNPLVTGELNWRTVWFRTDFPLSITIFWWEWLAWGTQAAGYHWVNLALHLTGSLVLWRFLRFLAIPGAFLAALLFLVHPVAVASVAWVSELKNTLSLPFFLGAAWCFMRWQRNRAGRRDLFLALMLFSAALLAKTSTVVLPPILLLLVWWRRGKVNRNEYFALIPFFLLSAVFGLLTIWFQSHQAYEPGAMPASSLGLRLARAGMAIWFYLAKAVLPLNLSLVYPQWTFSGWKTLGFAGLFLVAALLLGLRNRNPAGKQLFAALTYFVLALLPILGFVDMWFLTIAPVSDHFQYLALLGPVVLISATGRRFLKRDHFIILSTILLSGLAFCSHQRARVFHDDESLWRRTLAQNPKAWPGHNNLGCILAEHGDLQGATAHFREALALFPQNAAAHVNLGRALALQNQPSKAAVEFQAAVRLKPKDADTHAQFASFLMDTGRSDLALAEQQEAVRLNPSVTSKMELARIQQQTGRIRGALANYREIVKAKPDFVEALNNLAWILATSSESSLRNGAESVRYAEEACRLTKFADPLPLGTLAAAHAENGQFLEAVETCQKAIAAATPRGDEDFLKINRELLKRYQSRQPYHEGPAR